MTERVSIVALGPRDEAKALRAMIEAMKMEVRLLHPERPIDVSKALIKASEDDVVVLSAMGGSEGFLVGEFNNSSWLPAADAFDGVSFRSESVLISTAGATRDNGLIAAMLKSGGHLIAPNGTPDRRIILPWIGACLLRAQTGLAEAVHEANALVEPDSWFSYG